eukprot:3225495-Rhodomonas_salina.2
MVWVWSCPVPHACEKNKWNEHEAGSSRSGSLPDEVRRMVCIVMAVKALRKTMPSATTSITTVMAITKTLTW